MIVCPWKELKRYEAVIPGLAEAVAFVDGLQDLTPATYPLSGGNKVLVQAVTTKPLADSLIEAHREYLDIQYILEGSEVVGWAPIDTLTPAGEYDEKKDKIMYAGATTPLTVGAGYCYVVYPEDGHAPGTHLEQAAEVRKIVVKLKV